MCGCLCSQAAGGGGQQALAAVLAQAVPDLAAWHISRSSGRPAVSHAFAAAALDAPDAQVGMAAGCLVASTLASLSKPQQPGPQARDADPVHELVSTGADLVLSAIEEGSMRAAMDERAALERAQAQLASSSLNGLGKSSAAGKMPGRRHDFHHPISHCLGRSTCLACTR